MECLVMPRKSLTARKFAHICSIEKSFPYFRITAIFDKPGDQNRINPKTQTAYSFGYANQYQ